MMQQHFGAPELADMMPPGKYMDIYRDHINATDDVHDVDVRNVVILPQLVTSFAHAKSGKAADASGVRAEMLRLAPQEAAA
eukprot:6992124-Karenia_brevis.AAC.1